MAPTLRTASILAFLLTFSSLSIAAEEPYPLKLHRPLQPGATYDVHVTIDVKVDSNREIAKRQPIVNTTIVKGEITGRISDAHLDASGNCDKFTLAIDHLKDKGRDAIRPGTIIDVEYVSNKTQFASKDGKPIPDNARPILVELLHNNFAVRFTEDDVMGSKTPHKIGDSWDINPQAASDFSTADGLHTEPFNLKGTATLAAVENTGAPPTMRITSKIIGENFTSSAIPPRGMVENSQVTFLFTLLLPLDETLPALEFVETDDAVARVNNINSTDKLDIRIYRVRKMTLTPVTSSAAAPPAPLPAR